MSNRVSTGGRRRRRATAQDVADLAGVSRTAVSLVLNGHGAGNIAPKKQKAILAAAGKLNYVPNAAAVNLRAQRSKIVGILTDTIATTAYGGQVLAGAMDVARQAEYATMLVDTEDIPGAEASAVEVLRHRQVDGLLFAAQSFRDHTFELDVEEPAVLANCIDASGLHASFFPDEVRGGELAARVILEAGHRDIVHLTGHHEWLAAGMRAEGFRNAMTDYGLTGPIIETGWTIADGYRAASEVLTAASRPTAIVAANDRVAVGVILAASQLGLRVPHDLSVVGYDDDENVAAAMVPALTTVALPHRLMGEMAMSTLLSVIDGAELSPAKHPVPGPLVVRDSVAAPASV